MSALTWWIKKWWYFYRCTELISCFVYCVDSNKITSIPSEIGFLTNLKSLNLINNEIKALPSEIGSMTALTHLFIGECFGCAALFHTPTRCLIFRFLMESFFDFSFRYQCYHINSHRDCIDDQFMLCGRFDSFVWVLWLRSYELRFWPCPSYHTCLNEFSGSNQLF